MTFLLATISTYFFLLSNGGIFSREKIPPLDNRKKYVENMNFQPELLVGDTCYINAKIIGIRGEPLESSIEFGNLYYKDKVLVTEKPQGKWIRVSCTNGDVGVLGYVLKKYLSKEKIINTLESKHSKNILSVPDLSIGDTCYINSKMLGVRTEPSDTSIEFEKIYQNDEVIINEILEGKWVKITYNNGDVDVKGYILKKYLSEKKVITTSHTKNNKNILTNESLLVGDTCYVSKYILVVHSEALETSQELSSIYYNYLVTIVKRPNGEWIRIRYMNGDVGVVGYVLKEYLSKTKMSKR